MAQAAQAEVEPLNSIARMKMNVRIYSQVSGALSWLRKGGEADCQGNPLRRVLWTRASSRRNVLGALIRFVPIARPIFADLEYSGSLIERRFPVGMDDTLLNTHFTSLQNLAKLIEGYDLLFLLVGAVKLLKILALD